MLRSTNWVFTINNPDGLLSFDPSIVKSCWYQEEMGESGTHHFQGYIELLSRRTLASMKTLDGFETAHLEIRRGSQAQAIAYATKEETRLCGPYLYGATEDLNETGKRTDIDKFMADVAEGMSREDSFDAHPSIHARFPRFVCAAYERRRIAGLPPILEFVPNSDWQIALVEHLTTTPDSRKILWFYNVAGNVGKSYFALNYSPENSYVISSGKHADIIYAYNYERVIFFDWPRDAQDRFPYSVAESFKNGYALSTKYEVRRIRFAVPHVVVFSNFYPDTSKLSVDRFEIKEI